MSDNQCKLMNIIIQFAFRVCLDAVNSAYSQLGKALFKRPIEPRLVIIPVLEEYFNKCVTMIQTHEDVFINEWFNKMRECKVPISDMIILQIIVKLCLGAVAHINNDTDIEASRMNIYQFLNQHTDMAQFLTEYNISEEIITEPGKKLFDFKFVKY